MVSKSLMFCLGLSTGLPTVAASQALGDSKIAVSTIAITDLALQPFVQPGTDNSTHSGAIKGAVIGAAAGAGIGALIGYLQTHRTSVKDHSEDGRFYLVVISEGAVVGGILGALIGRHR